MPHMWSDSSPKSLGSVGRAAEMRAPSQTGLLLPPHPHFLLDSLQMGLVCEEVSDFRNSNWTSLTTISISCRSETKKPYRLETPRGTERKPNSYPVLAHPELLEVRGIYNQFYFHDLLCQACRVTEGSRLFPSACPLIGKVGALWWD